MFSGFNKIATLSFLVDLFTRIFYIDHLPGSSEKMRVALADTVRKLRNQDREFSNLAKVPRQPGVSWCFLSNSLFHG